MKTLEERVTRIERMLSDLADAFEESEITERESWFRDCLRPMAKEIQDELLHEAEPVPRSHPWSTS